MAFIRNDEKKDLSLPGLIDIIFLLLIFSLVTLSVSQAKVETKKRGERDIDFDLPEIQSRETDEVKEILQTLLFQIEHLDSRNIESPKVVFILYPSIEDSLSLQEVKSNALRDSMFAVFEGDFLKMSDREFARILPCRLIKKAIREYKEAYYDEPNPSNAVEIRAVRDTEFRIVNFIMEQCSTYGDTIPRIILRTLTGSEVKSGI